MKEKQDVRELLTHTGMVFFISTTCICLLAGIYGSVFMKGQALDCGAFFSPPLFGAISAVLSLITNFRRSKIPSTKESVLRSAILLIAIEAAVFGLNYLTGTVFNASQTVILLVSIAVIYILVCAVLHWIDLKSARDFNEELKKFQMKQNE